MTKEELRVAMKEYPEGNTLLLSEGVAIDMLYWDKNFKLDVDVFSDDLAELCRKISDEFGGIKVLMDPEATGKSWGLMKVSGMVLKKEDKDDSSV
jgi:hypothetical protein